MIHNLLVDGCIDFGLDKTQWTNTSRRHGTPNHHRLWKLHTGFQLGFCASPVFLQTLQISKLLWTTEQPSSSKCLNWLCLTVFSSLRLSLLLVQLFLPNFFLPVNFYALIKNTLICFDKALCEQPPLSVMTICDLPSLWRVSMIVF